jgi:hypothetical protein
VWVLVGTTMDNHGQMGVSLTYQMPASSYDCCTLASGKLVWLARGRVSTNKYCVPQVWSISPRLIAAPGEAKNIEALQRQYHLFRIDKLVLRNSFSNAACMCVADGGLTGYSIKREGCNWQMYIVYKHLCLIRGVLQRPQSNAVPHFSYLVLGSG